MDLLIVSLHLDLQYLSLPSERMHAVSEYWFITSAFALAFFKFIPFEDWAKIVATLDHLYAGHIETILSY